MKAYWYQTQERAFAPDIAKGWPEVIAAPHTKNGRLVRQDGDPSELLAAAKRALTFLQDNGMSHGADLARAIDKAEGK